jgi:hypothetical protein
MSSLSNKQRKLAVFLGLFAGGEAKVFVQSVSSFKVESNIESKENSSYFINDFK